MNSNVWEHFQKLNKSKVLCKLCSYSTNFSGSTSNMWRHLKAKHSSSQNQRLHNSEKRSHDQREDFLEDGETSPKIDSESGEEPVGKQRKITDVMHLTINGNRSEDSQKKNPQSDESTPTPMEKQPKISHIFLSKNATTKKREYVTSALSKMIAVDMLPLSFVEGDGFKEFMKAICPSYTIPARSTITSRINFHYEEVKKMVTQELRALEHVALTTDCWSSRNNESFITVTAHGITKNWEYKCFNLATESMPERHTAENLGSRLQNTCKEFEVVASSALKTKQEQLGLQQHKLIQCVKTRWNSMFYMIERLIEQRAAIVSVLGDRNITGRAAAIQCEVSENEWALLEQLKDFLQFFELATRAISLEKKVTISLIQPLVQSLIQNGLNKSNLNDDKLIKSIKLVVQSEINNRFGLHLKSGNLAPNIYDFCTYLDPRFKKEERISGMNQKVRRHLGESLENIDKKSESPLSQNTTEKNSILEQLFPDNRNVQKQDTEIDLYELEPGVPKSTNIFSWWKANSVRFPLLSLLARKYLCIPPTSTPSERAFSTAGNIVNGKRFCLSPENVKRLVFLNINLRKHT